MAEDRMIQALHYLTGEFSVSRDQWRDHHKGSDMLLDGLISLGYANVNGDRYAVSAAGGRMLVDNGQTDRQADQAWVEDQRAKNLSAAGGAGNG